MKRSHPKPIESHLVLFWDGLCTVAALFPIERESLPADCRPLGQRIS